MWQNSSDSDIVAFHSLNVLRRINFFFFRIFSWYTFKVPLKSELHTSTCFLCVWIKSKTNLKPSWEIRRSKASSPHIHWNSQYPFIAKILFLQQTIDFTPSFLAKYFFLYHVRSSYVLVSIHVVGGYLNFMLSYRRIMSEHDGLLICINDQFLWFYRDLNSEFSFCSRFFVLFLVFKWYDRKTIVIKLHCQLNGRWSKSFLLYCAVLNFRWEIGNFFLHSSLEERLSKKFRLG